MQRLIIVTFTFILSACAITAPVSTATTQPTQILRPTNTPTVTPLPTQTTAPQPAEAMPPWYPIDSPQPSRGTLTIYYVDEVDDLYQQVEGDSTLMVGTGDITSLDMSDDGACLAYVREPEGFPRSCGRCNVESLTLRPFPVEFIRFQADISAATVVTNGLTLYETSEGSLWVGEMATCQGRPGAVRSPRDRDRVTDPITTHLARAAFALPSCRHHSLCFLRMAMIIDLRAAANIGATMTPITVLLVDDHRRIHQIVAKLLTETDDIQLVAQASNGEEAITLAAEHQPDVILMDVVMPVMSGVEATASIRMRYPQCNILVLSSFQDHESVHSMLRNGAVGYVTKGNLASDLINTIRAVHEGNFVFSSEVAKHFLAEPAELPQEAKTIAFELTERELEVLGLMAEGLTNAQIAYELTISRSTVKFHVANVIRKIGVETRSEALVAAAKANLV